MVIVRVSYVIVVVVAILLARWNEFSGEKISLYETIYVQSWIKSS